MPGGRPGRERARARNYLLEHPHSTNAEVAAAVGVGGATVSFARQALIQEGLIPRSPQERRRQAYNEARKPIDFPPASPTAPVLVAPPAEPAPPQTPDEYETLDAQRLYDLAEGEEEIDDEQVRRRMIRKLRKMSFDPNLNPQYQMYAMAAHEKMLEGSRAATIGPGKPVTKDDAVERLEMIFKATGPELVLLAAVKAFGVAILTKLVELFKGREDGSTDQQAAPPGGAEDAVSPA